MFSLARFISSRKKKQKQRRLVSLMNDVTSLWLDFFFFFLTRSFRVRLRLLPRPPSSSSSSALQRYDIFIIVVKRAGRYFRLARLLALFFLGSRGCQSLKKSFFSRLGGSLRDSCGCCVTLALPRRFNLRLTWLHESQ
jgi:hypothetical protein